MVPLALAKRGYPSLLNGIRWVARANSGASAVAQNVITQVVLLGMSLGTGVVGARALGVVGRGQLAAIVLWPQVFAGIFALGIPAALIFHAKRAPKEERGLLYAALLLSGLSSVAMLVVGFFSISQALRSYGPETVRNALLSLLVAPQVLVSYILTAHLQVRGRFGDYNRFRLVPTAATLVALIFFATTKNLTPALAAICYLSPSVPAFIIVLFRAVRSASGPVIDMKLAFGKIVGYGTRAAGIDLLSTLSTQIDQLMVVSFLDPASMGAYVVALSVSRVPNVIFVAMQQVLVPRVAALQPESLTELVGRCVRVGSAAMFIVALVLGASLPFVLPHLFGHDFARSVIIARVLLFELLLTGAATLLAEAFKGVGRPGAVTLLQGTSLAATIVLLSLLIPRFGLLGAAIALVSAAALRLAILLTLYSRIVGTRPPMLLLNSKDILFVKNIFRTQLGARMT